jgi:predicted small secreted protein
MFKTSALIAAACVLCLQLSACNTIQGMGKDISKTGEVIEDAAKKAKK